MANRLSNVFPDLPLELTEKIEEYKSSFELFSDFRSFLANTYSLDRKYISDEMVVLAMKTFDMWNKYKETFPDIVYYYCMLHRVFNQDKNFMNFNVFAGKQLFESLGYYCLFFRKWLNDLVRDLPEKYFNFDYYDIENFKNEFLSGEFREFIIDLPERLKDE